MRFLPFPAAIGLGLQVCRDWDYYCDQGHAPLLHLQVTGCIQYLKKIESHPKFESRGKIGYIQYLKSIKNCPKF